MRRLFFLTGLVALLGSIGHAELTDEEIATFGGCYFARVTSAQLWRMRDQDGIIREFEPHGKYPDVLVSHGGWRAKIEKDGKVTVRSHPGIEPRLVFTFQDGTLVHLNADGRDCNFHYPNPIVYDDGRIVPLWPEDKISQKEMDREISAQWGFGNRWTFGFFSPNQAGAVLAMLGMACLALACRRRTLRGRLSFALAAATFLVMMAMTASRGAMVAVAAAIVPLLACLLRQGDLLERMRRRWKTFALVGLALVLVAGAVGAAAMKLRPAGGNKASDSLRVELLRAAPRMFRDAPGGWGSRRDVGRAYTDWYRPASSNRQMFGLVCDHLTNVVALGWTKGFLYFFAWFAGLFVFWRVAWRGGSAVPAVVWTVLGVTATFNVVLFARYVSWLPLASLAFLIPERGLRGVRFWCLPCVGGILAALLATAGLAVAGSYVRLDATRVTRTAQGVVVNGGEADVWLVADPDVLGLVTVSREIRDFYERLPTARPLGYTEHLDTVPSKGVRKLVLSGKHCRAFLDRYRNDEIRSLPEEIVFLAPSFGCSEVPVKLRAKSRVRIVIGEFAARYYGDYAEKHKWVTLVKGAEVYIPVWMRFCAVRRSASAQSPDL